MSRLEARLLHITTVLLTLTGVVYACLHYLLKPVDPFSVVNHPLEPHMMSLHILIAPVLILLIGVILHSHILFKLGTGARAGRRSGIYLIPIFLVMVLSGYLLQVFTGAAHKLLFWMHLSSGLAWASLYLIHQIISLKVRRAMTAQNFQINGVRVSGEKTITGLASRSGGSESISRNTFFRK